MSTWRKNAIDCLPESKKDFEDPDTSIYEVFSTLLHAAIDFHQTNNTQRLQAIYDLAAWCLRQQSKALWNVAGVSFYEHLGDHIITRQAMGRWVTPAIYAEIRGLLQRRLDNQTMQELDDMYLSNAPSTKAPPDCNVCR